MWEHPVTSEQLQRLENWGYHIVYPVSKKLACNDVGVGALAEVAQIISITKQLTLDSLRSITHANQDNKVKKLEKYQKHSLLRNSKYYVISLTFLFAVACSSLVGAKSTTIL